MFEEVEPAGLEFVTDESQPEHPAPEVIFFIVCFGLPCRGFLLRKSLMGNRKAELDVGLDFAGVKSAVEKAELDGTPGEGGMKVKLVIAGAVVKMVPSVWRLLVPEVRDTVSHVRLFPRPVF